jgi:hypothetical protein
MESSKNWYLVVVIKRKIMKREKRDWPVFMALRKKKEGWGGSPSGIWDKGCLVYQFQSLL